MTTKSKNQAKTEEASINGILVQVNEDQLDVQVLGTTKPTEVPTLLELAAIIARKQLGIN